MAFSLPNLFRLLIVLLLTAHVFVMYCIARTMDGEIGSGIGTIILASGFALVMLLPIVWAVALPEFPEMYLRHVRGRRRYDAGRCPTCGYTPGVRNPTRCSECGEPVRKPEQYHVGIRTIRLFILINLLAWVLGCAAGEAWCQNDEWLFDAKIHATAMPMTAPRE